MQLYINLSKHSNFVCLAISMLGICKHMWLFYTLFCPPYSLFAQEKMKSAAQQNHWLCTEACASKSNRMVVSVTWYMASVVSTLTNGQIFMSNLTTVSWNRAKGQESFGTLTYRIAYSFHLYLMSTICIGKDIGVIAYIILNYRIPTLSWGREHATMLLSGFSYRTLGIDP